MRRGRSFPVLSVLLAAMVAAPLLAILAATTRPAAEVQSYVLAELLPRLLGNTALLLAGVSMLCTVLGLTLGWLTGVCEYPGRRFFSWALVLPLAIPTYVLAFIFLGLMDFSGPVAAIFRHFSPGATFRWPDFRAAPAVILVMSLGLYPYVYLLCHSGFATQGGRMLEVGRTLGLPPLRLFFRVALPLVRPYLAGGVALVMMETLADFGTVAVFNYDTFTTAIYTAWYGLYSMAAAAQLSAVLLFVVLAVLTIEQRWRGRRRYTQMGAAAYRASRIQLRGTAACIATGFCFLVLLAGFVVPALQLAVWVLSVASEELNWAYIYMLAKTVFLGLTAALLCTGAALCLVYGRRLQSGWLAAVSARIATLGYALPGPVLAVGILAPVTRLDRWLQAGLNLLPDGSDMGLHLQNTLVVMVAAYMIRFLAVAHNPVAAAAQRLAASIDEAARLLGARGWSLVRRVHIPVLRSGLVTAAILVLVDVIKEMPITLMTRPFGWDTLAVKVYEYTAEGEWELAALPALGISLAGLVPVVLLIAGRERR